MEIAWVIAGATALMSLVAALAWQRAVDRTAWPTWGVVFDGAGRKLVEWLKRDLGRHMRVLDSAIDVAREDHRRGAHADAARVLSAAETTASVHAGVLRAWLRRCTDVARSLAAVRPVPPLQVRGMQLGPLRALALGHRVGDTVLVTSGERFRWSTAVLSAGLNFVEWAFGASALGAQSAQRDDQLERALDEATRAHADLQALNDHVVTTVEHLSAAIDATGDTARR